MPRSYLDLPISETSAAAVLRIHTQPGEPVRTEPVCNCSMSVPIPGYQVVNAGCPKHGVQSDASLRSSYGGITYGIAGVTR